VAYTFGAGTGDDINWAATVSFGANSRAHLVCGWFFPTTLTAGRGYWSAGNIIGVEVDSTTSELRLRTDNTTDGQWTTTGAGITVNEWVFIAVFGTFNNSGPSAEWRVWIGRIGQAPVEVTVTQAVAPAGNFAASSSWTIGNKGTGTLSFQGDISDVVYITTSGAAAVDQMFFIETYGSAPQAAADLILERFVRPIWMGELMPPGGRKADSVADAVYWPGSVGGVGLRCTYRATDEQPFVVPTINGATVSENRGPRSLRLIRPFLSPSIVSRRRI